MGRVRRRCSVPDGRSTPSSTTSRPCSVEETGSEIGPQVGLDDLRSRSWPDRSARTDGRVTRSKASPGWRRSSPGSPRSTRTPNGQGNGALRRVGHQPVEHLPHRGIAVRLSPFSPSLTGRRWRQPDEGQRDTMRETPYSLSPSSAGTDTPASSAASSRAAPARAILNISALRVAAAMRCSGASRKISAP